MAGSFNAAYTLDRGYRVAHHGATTLPPPRSHGRGGASKTGVVWADETDHRGAVEHDPVSPAVGYRIDYAGRSVVISGDSNASAALFTLAEGADLLFHDAIPDPPEPHDRGSQSRGSGSYAEDHDRRH